MKLGTLTRELQRRDWKIVDRPGKRAQETDLPLVIARFHDRHLAFVIGRATAAKWDALQGALADSILVAQRLAVPHGQATKVALLTAPHITPRMVDRLSQYVERRAPGQAWGVLDDRGLLAIRAPGLEIDPVPVRHRIKGSRRRVNAFSDIGQLVIKALLARHHLASPSTIAAPQGHYRTYESFAEALGIATATVWQVMSQLEHDGYLDSEGRIQRLEGLMDTWRGVLRVRRPEPIPLRWSLPREEGLQRLIKFFPVQHSTAAFSQRLQYQHGCWCVRGFSAAHALGLAVVPGSVLEIYVEAESMLEKAGLSRTHEWERPDVIAAIPSFPESVFRSAVIRHMHNAPVADVVQCWLDVVDDPARGREQADAIWREAFGRW